MLPMRGMKQQNYAKTVMVNNSTDNPIEVTVVFITTESEVTERTHTILRDQNYKFDEVLHDRGCYGSVVPCKFVRVNQEGKEEFIHEIIGVKGIVPCVNLTIIEEDNELTVL